MKRAGASGYSRLPDRIRPRLEDSQGSPADEVQLNSEGVVDGGVGFEETLGRGFGLEAGHFAFSLPDRQMRIFGAVVLTKTARPMTIFKFGSMQRAGLGFESFGNGALRLDALIFQ